MRKRALEPLESRQLLSINYPPYLQLGNAPVYAAADQASLQWQTFGNADSFDVYYRELGGSAWIDAGDPAVLNTGVESRYEYSRVLSGLRFDSDYEYRVERRVAGSVVEQWQREFHTRLAPGDSSSFSFMTYGDTADSRTPDVTPRMAQLTESLDVDFGIVIGDVVQNSGVHAEYDRRHTPALNPGHVAWSGSHIEVNAIGNHELTTNSGKPFEDTYENPIVDLAHNRPEHNFAWVYGNTFFASIDSTMGGNGEALEPQLAWLESQLAADQSKWKIVYFHHPLTSDNYQDHYPETSAFDRVMGMMLQYKVDAVLTGHDHSYQRSYQFVSKDGAFLADPNDRYVEDAGVAHMVIGTGGGNWQGFPANVPDAPYLARGYSIYTNPPVENGGVKVEVSASTLEFTYFNLDGEIMDHFEIGPDVDPPTIEVQQTGESNRLDFLIDDDSGKPVVFSSAPSLTRNGVALGFDQSFSLTPPPASSAAATFGTLTLTSSSYFQSGAYTLSIVLVDPQGNVNNATYAFSLADDRLAPLVTIVEDGSDIDFDASANLLLATPAPLHVSIVDGTGIATQVVQLDGAVVGTTFTPPLGRHDLRVSATDNDGNSLTKEFVVFVNPLLEVRTVTVREGLNGYAGTADTTLYSTGNLAPGGLPYYQTPFGNNTTFAHDAYLGGGIVVGLIRFDLSMLPAGAKISDAAFSYFITTGQEPADGLLTRSAVFWDENTTYATFGPVGGVNTNDLYPGDVYLPGFFGGAFTIDVTSDVRIFQTNNRGWVLRPNHQATTVFASSELNNQPLRPSLTITYATERRPEPRPMLADYFFAQMIWDRALEKKTVGA